MQEDIVSKDDFENLDVLVDLKVYTDKYASEKSGILDRLLQGQEVPYEEAASVMEPLTQKLINELHVEGKFDTPEILTLERLTGVW